MRSGQQCHMQVRKYILKKMASGVSSQEIIDCYGEHYQWNDESRARISELLSGK